MEKKFKSEAHRAKFEELVAKGKISQKEADKWHSNTGSRKLPERVKPKAPRGGRR